jgi:hypothetical protein
MAGFADTEGRQSDIKIKKGISGRMMAENGNDTWLVCLRLGLQGRSHGPVLGSSNMAYTRQRHKNIIVVAYPCSFFSSPLIGWLGNKYCRLLNYST